MSEKVENKTEEEDEARRAFLKKAGKVAAVVPVATLLVAATSKGAHAVPQLGLYGQAP